MAIVFKKIGDAQTDIHKMNSNFDRIALELSDKSGTFSSSATTSFSLGTGASQAIEVSVIDALEIYQVDKLAVIPRLNIFVDHDADFTYSFPLGSNLATADGHGISIDIFQSKSVLNAATNEKATVPIIIHNNSGNTHTFYVYIDVFYVPAPEVGVARRATA